MLPPPVFLSHGLLVNNRLFLSPPELAGHNQLYVTADPIAKWRCHNVARSKLEPGSERAQMNNVSHPSTGANRAACCRWRWRLDKDPNLPGLFCRPPALINNFSPLAGRIIKLATRPASADVPQRATMRVASTHRDGNIYSNYTMRSSCPELNHLLSNTYSRNLLDKSRRC